MTYATPTSTDTVARPRIHEHGVMAMQTAVQRSSTSYVLRMLPVGNNICTSFLGWTSYLAFEFVAWVMVVAFIRTLVLQLM
jgi:hypothetical protein